MQYIYFGLFSDLFKKIYNKIFKPIFDKVYQHIMEPLSKVIGELFRAIFTPIYNQVLKPILENVVIAVFKTFWNFIKAALSEVLYKIEAYIYKVIDGIVNIFEVLMGTKRVYFADERKTGTIFELFLGNKDFMRVFWTFVLISISIIMIISVVATMKAAYGDDNRGTNTLYKVLKDILKSVFTIFTGPFYAFLLVMLSKALAETTATVFTSNLSSNHSGKITFGSALFALSTMDIGGTNAGAIKEYKRSLFLYNELDYSNINQVKLHFQLEKINSILGIIIGIIVLISIVKVLYTLSARVFDILILFLCLPFFAASIPIDNGEKYKRWKDMFIGRMFIANGTYMVFLATQILFLPWCISLNIDTGNSIANYSLIMILIVAALTNICKFPSLAEGLFSFEAARIDSSNNQVMLEGATTIYKFAEKAVSKMNSR